MERDYIIQRLVTISDNWRACAKRADLFNEDIRDNYNDCADEIETLVEDCANF